MKCINIKRTIVVLGLVVNQVSFSQKASVQALTIGDSVPNLKFENVLNYKEKNARLFDFKQRLLILDFWSTWCSSCIASFPKMESLQNEFKDDIRILLVNPRADKHNTKEKVLEVLNRIKQRTDFYPSLPVPILASDLQSYFLFKSVPHVVWIFNGRIRAVTGAADVNEKNIRALLDSANINLPVKNDWLFDKQKPLLVDGNGGNNDFIYRAIFTGYKPGIGQGSNLRFDENKEVNGLYFVNYPLLRLVTTAYGKLLANLGLNRIFCDLKEPGSYTFSEDDRLQLYCYDLVIPATRQEGDYYDKLMGHLRQDLKRYFNLRARIEKRKLSCIVFSATSEIEKLFTRYDKPNADYIDDNGIRVKSKFFHNFTIAEILQIFNRFKQPIIDETGMSDRGIDIDFPENFDLSDQAAVISFLQGIGFDIKVEERELEVFVITDKATAEGYDVFTER